MTWNSIIVKANVSFCLVMHRADITLCTLHYIMYTTPIRSGFNFINSMSCNMLQVFPLNFSRFNLIGWILIINLNSSMIKFSKQAYPTRGQIWRAVFTINSYEASQMFCFRTQSIKTKHYVRGNDWLEILALLFFISIYINLIWIFSVITEVFPVHWHYNFSLKAP